MSENDLYSKLTKFIENNNDKQTQEIRTLVRKEIEELKEKIDEEVKKRKDLEIELQEVKNKYKTLEKKLRKNGIIIFNFDYKEDENLLEFTVRKLNELLGTNIQRDAINNVYAIGKKKENRPIIVKFTSYLTKQTLLKNCRKLKGTNIVIAEELTLEEREKRKLLQQHLREARSKKLNAYIRGEKLYINGEEYKAEELTQIHQTSDDEQVKQQRSDSAPPTPTSKTQEDLNADEGEKENKGSAPKKRKIIASTSSIQPGRSSSRLIEKEKEGKLQLLSSAKHFISPTQKNK